MNAIEILPADSYTVVNKTIIQALDQSILMLLYQPIIGAFAISLYQTLKSNLDRMEVMSIPCTHHTLMNSTHFKLNDIVEARHKLEAVGLLKTYFKKDKTNHYVYELYSPLSVYDFFNHPLLSNVLLSNIGSKEYERIIQYYTNAQIDLKDYRNISKTFSDLYTPVINQHMMDTNQMKRKQTIPIEIKSTIDFNLIKASFKENYINEIAMDQGTIDMINKLGYLYGIDTLNMIHILRSSIGTNGVIDRTKLKEGCRHYYQFEYHDTPLKLIYVNQPEELISKAKDATTRTRLIYNFETLTPYEFLQSRYNGATPTSRDLRLIETLMIDLKLNPGVVNVLIDYVLKINDNKLNKNYIETIAGQWKRLNIKTVQEAMSQAEKEYRKQKNKPSTARTKEIVKVPEWFNKQVEEVQDTETSKQIEDLLKEFGK